MSNICTKCGKVLCVCFFLAVGGVPVIEAYSPPEEHCTAAPLCAERPIATKPDDAPEHDYSTTGQPAIELAETGGATRLVIESPLGIDTAAALALT
jgi:hypothetical protein